MKLIAVGVSKKYGKREVLSNFNISVEQGEIVALLGPNGAGKTTSFYIMVGITGATGGKVIFNDIDITNYPLYARAQLGIGYLPQEASIFRKMSVEENLLVALETKYRKEKNSKQIINEKM